LEQNKMRKDNLPKELREALDDEFEVPGIGRLGITDSVRADRARAIAAALRWSLTCHSISPEISDAIAALELEAHDA
jgi:hypothetical protein